MTTSISGGQNGGPGETTGAWEASRLADLSLLTASPPTSCSAHASGPHQPSEAPGQASYLHGVPALEPSPIDPCPAATPGQASWGQRVAVRVDTLGLQQAVWMLLLLFRILPPAASLPPFKSPPPAQLGAGTWGQAQEGPPRRLPAFCRASCLCPPAAASPPATAEDAQSFAEPADSAARAPSRGGNKALIFRGRPFILHCRRGRTTRPACLLLLAVKTALPGFPGRTGGAQHGHRTPASACGRHGRAGCLHCRRGRLALRAHRGEAC